VYNQSVFLVVARNDDNTGPHARRDRLLGDTLKALFGRAGFTGFVVCNPSWSTLNPPEITAVAFRRLVLGGAIFNNR
jgi:hypothetical protein